jgi:hypothetical protein
LMACIARAFLKELLENWIRVLNLVYLSISIYCSSITIAHSARIDTIWVNEF